MSSEFIALVAEVYIINKDGRCVAKLARFVGSGKRILHSACAWDSFNNRVKPGTAVSEFGLPRNKPTPIAHLCSLLGIVVKGGCRMTCHEFDEMLSDAIESGVDVSTEGCILNPVVSRLYEIEMGQAFLECTKEINY